MTRKLTKEQRDGMRQHTIPGYWDYDESTRIEVESLLDDLDEADRELVNAVKGHENARAEIDDLWKPMVDELRAKLAEAEKVSDTWVSLYHEARRRLAEAEAGLTRAMDLYEVTACKLAEAEALNRHDCYDCIKKDREQEALREVAKAARAWASESREEIGHDKVNLTWVFQAIAALDALKETHD